MPIRGDEIETVLTVNRREYLRGFRDAERDAQGFVQRTNRTLSGLGSSASGGGSSFGFGFIGQSLKMIPGLGVLASALGSVTDKVQDGIKIGFDYNRTLEESRLAFTRLFKSADQSDKFIHSLQQLRKDGIALDESSAAARRFLAARFDRDQVPQYIRAVGDAARFTGAEVDAITRALTQMSSKGRVSAEEVNQQLAEQGIDAWRYLAEAVAEVDKNFAKLSEPQRAARIQKMAELGQLSGKGGAQAILRGIERDFGGYSRAFSEQTATGIEAQLNATASRLAGTATGPFFERYKALLRGTLDVANSETGEALARGAATASNNVLNSFGESLKLGGDIGAGLIKGVGGKGFEAAKQFIGEFADGIGSHSPATEFIPLGASAAQGFKIGFSGEMGQGGGVMGLFQGGRGPLGGGDIRSRLEMAADDPRVRAFFEAIRRAEGGEPNRIVGGGTFTDFSRHPNRVGMVGPAGPSTAAGSFQITGTNWQRIAPILGLTDFAARNQLLAALYLFNEEGGLDRLLAGDIEGAIRAAGRDWAAVPGSPLPGRQVSRSSFLSNFQGELGGGGTGRGFSGRTPDEQFQMLLQIPGFRAYIEQTYGHTDYLPGTRDLRGGTGEFNDFFRDVPGGSGLDEPAPTFARLQDLIPEVRLEAVKFTQVIDRPTIPFPGAEEGVEELNTRIQQTVPILQRAQKEASFLGITGKDAGAAFEDAWVGAFTRTELGFKGMGANMALNFAQSVNQMVQEWAAAQIRMGLGKFLNWGLNALFGAAAGGLSGGSASSNAAFGRPGGGITAPGTPFLGPGTLHFASGGSFMVGGPGGTDKTPVFFMASRGEEVNVRTPAQQRTQPGKVEKHYHININVPASRGGGYVQPKDRMALAQDIVRLLG
jgi:tape measure domain-containing protein